MNEALLRLAQRLHLGSADNKSLRLEFGLACVVRVEHLLEDPAVVDCLGAFSRHVRDGGAEVTELSALTVKAAELANQHQGSKSIDGCGHAAVSATFAVANAIAGKALQAADYAAYALVYAQSGYGAVAERESFDAEFGWQVARLQSIGKPRG